MVKKAVYDTQERWERPNLLPSMIFGGHDNKILFVKEKRYKRRDEYVGHVEDATFVVNNQLEGFYPLELFAKTGVGIRVAASRIEELTQIKLELVGEIE